MLEYFIEDFDGEKLICDGDAQDCMNLETVVERLNEYKNLIETYEDRLEGRPTNYSHNNMKQLIEALGKCEYDLQNKKHDLEQEKISLWFNEDWALKLGKAKPSEKDKEKAINDILKEKILEVKELEVEFNCLKRQYDVALRYSYEVLR